MTHVAAHRLRFVGRSREIGELVARLREASEGQPSVSLVWGPAGIGKTRLIDELELLRGISFLRMRCMAVPLAITIRDLLPKAFLESANGATAKSLERLFLRASEGLAKRCAREPVALVIEDVHDAEPATRHFVEYLVDRISVANAALPRIALILTFRDDALHDSARSDFIANVLRGRRCQLHLQPLTRQDVASLLTPYDLPPTTTHELIRLSEGNPLYLEELLWSALTSGSHAVSQSAYLAIRTRLANLSPATRSAVYAASVLGTTFTHDDLAAVVAQGESDLLSSLQEGSDAQIIMANPSTPNVYRFRHAIVREVTYSALIPEQRHRLHARAARVIAQRDFRGRASEIAAHSEQAGWHTRAYILYSAIGTRSAEIHDFPTAASAYERALANISPHDAVLPSIGAKCASALAAVERFDDAITLLRSLIGRPQQLDGAAYAEMYRQLAVCLGRSGRRRQALEELEIALATISKTAPELSGTIIVPGAALAAFGGPSFREESDRWMKRLAASDHAIPNSDRSRVPAIHAISSIFADDWSAGIGTFQKTLGHVRRLHDTAADFEITLVLADYRRFASDINDAASLYRYAFNIAESEQSPWLLHIAGVKLVRLLTLTGQLSEASALLSRCVETPAYGRLARVAIAGCAVLLGTLVRDDALVDQYLDDRYIKLASEGGSMIGDIAFGFVAALRARGQFEKALDIIKLTLPSIDQPWEARPFLAMVPLWGDAECARRALSMLEIDQPRIPRAAGYELLARAYMQVRKRTGSARQNALRAARIFRESGLRLLEAMALEAAERRRDALNVFREIGDAYDVARLSGSRERDERLTIRQQQVARLVAGGYTNKAIADRLGIAEKTVGVHLYGIYRILGVSSRAQLATYIAQQHQS